MPTSSSEPTVAAGREQRLVKTFVELTDTLVEDFDIVDFFTLVAQRIVELGIAGQAGILVVDDTGTLRFMAASNERTELLELFQIQSSEGPCQDCFRTGAPVTIARLDAEIERWPRFAPRALATGFASVHAFPLRLRDTVLGALNLFNDEPGPIDPESLAVVQALADVATISLVQQRELQRAHTVTDQLQHALHSRVAIEQSKGMIFEQAQVSMSDAFEMMRFYSRNHNVKISDTARRIVDGTLRGQDLTAPR